MSGNQPVRQRYALATGQGLEKAPPKNPSPGFKSGGKVNSSPKGGKKK